MRAIDYPRSMPSKEELIAKVMFLINSGAQRLAVSLNGVARNMAVALNEAIKEGKFLPVAELATFLADHAAPTPAKAIAARRRTAPASRPT